MPGSSLLEFGLFNVLSATLPPVAIRSRLIVDAVSLQCCVAVCGRSYATIP